MRKQKRSKKSVIKSTPVITTPPGRRKVWFFRLVSLVLIPALFFGILELVLRCFDYGYSPGAIIKHKLEDKEVYCHNYKFGWRFFPHSIARQFDGFIFDTKKTPQTYRIFILGSSAAAGTPAPNYNFGHILEVMLDKLYPDINFEVHTIAMPAINSHAVLEMAKDSARYQPDLYIVYMGNNEIVGPYGPGTVFAPLSSNLPAIRANIALKSIRTGQLLEQAMQWITHGDGTQKQWGGMEMFLEKQVRYNDPALEIAYRHFEKNLRDICQTGLHAGAAVIVSNVPSNLKDCPPFSSLHGMELMDAEKQTWQEIYQEGIALETEGRFAQAIEKYLDAERIDETFADLQFRLGRCYWNAGNYQKAKEKYTKAREYDTLRFRADNRINEIIRAVTDTGQEDRLYFVDSVKAFEAASPHHIPGTELFYEHVHMKFKGNYVLAKSLLPYIQKTLPSAKQPDESFTFSEEEIAKNIAYTDYERVVYLDLMYQSFLQRPPFTNQLNHEQSLANTKRQIDEQLLCLKKSGLDACTEQHRRAIQDRPDDWQMLFQYAAFLNSGRHDIKAEEAELRKVIKWCPYDLAYLNLGRNLHSQSRIKEALSVLNYLLKLNPNAAEAHIELASIYEQRREYEKDIQHLLKALSLEPEGMISLYINLADAYDKTGNPDKAIRVLRKAINLFPEENAAPAHAFLAYLLYNQNDYENALKEIHYAIKINPDIRNNPTYDSLLKIFGIKPK